MARASQSSWSAASVSVNEQGSLGRARRGMLRGVKRLHSPRLVWLCLWLSALTLGSTVGCASDALSLEDPVVRTVQINPNVLSVQRLQHTLTFTVNFSDAEREEIRVIGMAERNLEDLGLQVDDFEILSGFEFAIDVSVLPEPSLSAEPQVVSIVVETGDGHRFVLEGFITLLSL